MALREIDKNIKSYKRKYYWDKIVKSTLWFIVIWGMYYLLISTLEYFLWLSPSIRVILMIIMITASVATLSYFIFIPLLRSFGILKPKQDDQAAREIGSFFPHIGDKLLNYLQLRDQAGANPQNPWYQMSARQKEEEVGKEDYASAINIPRNNRRGLQYFLSFLLLVVLILMFYPALITDSAERIWNPNQKFQPKAPFDFIIDPSSLQCVQGSPVDIRVSLKGSALPQSLDIQIEDEVIPMQEVGQGQFLYHIDRVNHSFSFKLVSSPYSSPSYTVKVLEKVSIQDMRLYVKYPSHLGKKDGFINAMGDLQLPEGSTLTWSIESPQVDRAELLAPSTAKAFVLNQGFYTASYRPTEDGKVSILLYSIGNPNADSINTQITLIKDQMPSLQVSQEQDSSDLSYAVLHGEAGDDHGLSALSLVYKISAGGRSRFITKKLPIQNKKFATINTLIDFKKLSLAPGSNVEYYIQATDNDVVHGGKTVRSAVYSYHSPSTDELKVMGDKMTQEAIQDISKGQSNSQKSTKLLEESKKSLISNKTLSFESKQNFKQLEKQNEEIKKNLEDFKDKLEKQKDLHKDLENENLEQKEDELEKIADDLLQDKLEKQLKRINELLEKLEKNQANVDQIEDIQKQQKNIENELERLEELAKRLEMQVKMDELSLKVDSAALEELRMSMQMKEKPKDDQQLDSERQDQNKLMDDIKKEMEELAKKNEDMKSPFNLDKVSKEEMKAKNNITHSDQERKNNKMQKASQFSEDANQNLMQMSEMLQDMANDADMQEMEQDIAAMRRILQNLLKISFNQESLIASTQNLRSNSPKFGLLAKNQNEIRQQVRFIEDSLRKIASKDMKMGAQMNEELESLLQHLDQSILAFESRDKNSLLKQEQLNMMHVNNLTLFFGEGLNNKISNMNQQKQQKSKGNSSCNKPGGKKPKPGEGKSSEMRDIITQQKKLGNQIQQMQAAMQRKQGNKQGQNKPSENGKSSENGKPSRDGDRQTRMQEAEMLARLAKQQEDLERRIQELNSELKKDGKGLNDLTDAANKMEKNQEDIINKRLLDNLMNRQEEILTKLLKSEEAIREQEQDDKRQAEQVINVPKNNLPSKLLPFLAPNTNAKEYYKGNTPELNEYYQLMIQKYYQNLH